jgi:hypothetical protein
LLKALEYQKAMPWLQLETLEYYGFKEIITKSSLSTAIDATEERVLCPIKYSNVMALNDRIVQLC